MRLIEALDADHDPLTDRVGRMSELVAAVEAGDRTPSAIQAELREQLDSLRSDLIDHFGREEEWCFPFFREALPDVGAQVDQLEAAHDQMCGAVTRLVHLTARPGRHFVSSFPHLVHVFHRFAETYSQHAAGERAILRNAAVRLTPDQAQALEEAARGLT